MRASCRSKWPLLYAALIMLTVGALHDYARGANGSVAYTYDALGRVTTASYDTGICIVYTYDANSNRLTETVLVSASGNTGVWGCFNWNERKWGAS